VATPKNIIELGWRVDTTDQLNPTFWANDAEPELGSHSPDDLAWIDPTEISRHTVIIAQSGSGKSFFLGRLLEEILLKTQSRVIVIDPNADFRQIGKVVDSNGWRAADPAKPRYDKEAGFGDLPTETSRTAFETPWSKKVSKKLYMRGVRPGAEAIQVNWVDLPVDWLFEDADPLLQSELVHMHSFMTIIAPIIRIKRSTSGGTKDNLSETQDLCRQCRSKQDQQRLPHNKIIEKIKSHVLSPAKDDEKTDSPVKDRYVANLRLTQAEFDASLQRAAMHLSFVSPSAEHHYFRVAVEKRGSSIFTFSGRVTPSVTDIEDLSVLDLPSIDNPADRLMCVSAFIEHASKTVKKKWEEAISKAGDKDFRDERVPTFIVVDEAHNLVFDKAETAAQRRLRDQFRTIAAEGRKFGLFLILVTQRPDKLDERVLSEMENRAIMRLGSEGVLETTRKALGLSDKAFDACARCFKMPPGRAYLAGPWAGALPEDRPFLYTAMRRTVEGGRNLDKKWWNKPRSDGA